MMTKVSDVDAPSARAPEPASPRATDIAHLLSLLESAGEGSPDLDGRIYCAVNQLGFRSVGRDGRIHFEPDKNGTHTMLTPHPYTTSLDAALTLVPQGMGWSYMTHAMTPNGAEPRAHVDGVSGKGATPALALCIAALKARILRTP